MRSHLLLAFALAIAAVSPVGARAQLGIPVAVGERVRLTTATERGRHRLAGRVIAVSDDSVTLDTGRPGRSNLAISEITGVEVSGGRRTNGRRGMVYGLFAGAVTGAIVGVEETRKGHLVTCDFQYGGCFSPSDYQAETVTSHSGGAILGGIYGLIIGGIGGRFYHTERWITRTLGMRDMLRITPASRSTITATLTLRF